MMRNIFASRKSTLAIYILFAATLLLLGGCSGGVSKLGAQDRVVGLVSSSAPLANSNLSFYAATDTSQGPQGGGVLVATARANTNGHFLSSRFSARTFRVVATGGTLNGQPIKGVLRAHVRSYEFGNVVHVNLATTLVSAYFDATPGITLAQAETAVGKFLKITGTNLGSGYVPYDSAAFNQTAFHQAANAYPDINIFIDTLVREMKADAAATHVFPKQTPNPAAAAAKKQSPDRTNPITIRLKQGFAALEINIATEIAKGALELPLLNRTGCGC